MDEQRFEPFPWRVSASLLVGAPSIVNSIVEAKRGVHGARRTTWRGHALYKDPFDFFIYTSLLWDLKPRTILEIGAGTGASALWFHDMTRALDLQTEIIAVDRLLPTVDLTAKITFERLDLFQLASLEAVLDRDLPRPLLVVEDAHVNLGPVLDAVTRRLEPGDYLVVEDTLDPVKYQEFAKFMCRNGEKFEVDSKLADMFGYNATFNVNSILRKVESA